MPQGTKLRVLLFLLMINDVSTATPTFKYVDDTMRYTITKNPESTDLQDTDNDVVSWSKCNNICMKINESKTKEMLVCFNCHPPQVKPIHVDGILLERVSSVNLLGLRITDDLTWSCHVNMIKKAQGCMYSLNLLQRTKVSGTDIIHIFKFCTKFRPIIEYAATVWHLGLTVELTEALESIQARATCKDWLLLIWTILQLCILLPPKVNAKNARNSKKYPSPPKNTGHYKKSFVLYALYNLQ